MLDRRNRSQHQIADIFGTDTSHDDLEWYGMDWGAPTPIDDGLSTVEVNDVMLPLSAVLGDLQSIDPIKDSTSFGIDIYLEALSLFI